MGWLSRAGRLGAVVSLSTPRTRTASSPARTCGVAVSRDRSASSRDGTGGCVQVGPRRHRCRQGHQRAADGVARSLRHCEEQGLLQSSRSPGGHRHYAEDDVDRVGYLRRLHAAGCPVRPSSVGSERRGRCAVQPWARSGAVHG
ncbi:MerR family transcriptional regulator [Streptomyces sp. T12]|uniref:MerR family transcriptional regulator n=1 Tax=Streptomyces sp. T12 TaxID=477697 RepID=UPI0037DA1814